VIKATNINIHINQKKYDTSPVGELLKAWNGHWYRLYLRTPESKNILS